MRTDRSIVRVLAIAALALFTVWITWRAKTLETRLGGRSPTAALTGKHAPDFALQTLDGRTISLANYRGKNVIVSFWASWCGPCRLEIPALRKFYRQTHTAGSDYEILAISMDQTREAAQGAATEFKMPFPVLLDLNGKVAKNYLIEGIPSLVVIDKSGSVKYAIQGFDPGMEYQLARQLNIPNYTPAKEPKD